MLYTSGPAKTGGLGGLGRPTGTSELGRLGGTSEPGELCSSYLIQTKDRKGENGRFVIYCSSN